MPNFTCDQCGFAANVEPGPVTCRCGKYAVVTTSRGLGDTVAKITKAAGLKQCGGCRRRQDALNEMLPYGEKGQP